jgi:hypothetical protein
MYRFLSIGCVLSLTLSMSTLSAQEQPAENPAVKKLDRDIPRHKDFLKRIEQSNGAGDVIFLGDSITHGWEGQKSLAGTFRRLQASESRHRRRPDRPHSLAHYRRPRD